MVKAIRPTIRRLTTGPRSHIFAVTQRKPEALARERRNGGIVSLQATPPHAPWINAFARAARDGGRPRLRFAPSVGVDTGFWDGQSDSPDDSPPHYRPRFHIVAVTQQKPEALARERRNGGIVSLQAAKAIVHIGLLRSRPRDGARPRLRFEPTK
jgi:hypothetical protein